MAFVSRARRRTDAPHVGNEAPLVGPGAYEKPGFADRAPFASASAFATSAERDVNAPANYNPGPGAYGGVSTGGLYGDAAPDAFASGAVGGAAFANRVARFPRKKESFAENPGPGTYPEGNYPKSKWMKRTFHRSEMEGPSVSDAGTAPRVHFARLPSAPSVPSRHQSFGYEEGGTGELVMQKPPEGGHAGFGKDKVGPTDYNPKYTQLHNHKHTTWGRSRSRRTELTVGEALETPGPGRYERTGNGVASFSDSSTWITKDKLRGREGAAKERRRGAGVKGTSAAAGAVDGRPRRPTTLKDDPQDVLSEDRVPPMAQKSNSMFASRALRGHQQSQPADDITPGPGAYRQDSQFRTRRVPERNQFFLSTQQRDYEVDPSALYHAATYYTAPGPGAYDAAKRAAAFKPLSALLPDAAPFASTAERFPAARMSKTVPGPGAYDEMNAAPGTLVTDVARRTRARGGVFGTKSARFAYRKGKDAAEAKKGYLFRDGENPGPGAYESGEGIGVAEPVEDVRQPHGSLMMSRRRRRAAVSAFASHSKRFPHSPPPAGVVGGIAPGAPPSRRIKAVSQPGNPPPGTYTLEDLWAPPKRYSMQSEAFMSRAQRFGIKAGDVIAASEPGPGAYMPARTHKGATMMQGERAGVPSVSYAGFGSNQRRLAQETAAAGPGPGSYDAYDPYASMMRRSFNVTIDGVVF